MPRGRAQLAQRQAGPGSAGASRRRRPSSEPPRALSDRYLDALRRDILAHVWKWTPETVFLGGGTPGMMETAELKSLLDAIPGRPWTEATLEAAPGNITLEKARAWAKRPSRAT